MFLDVPEDVCVSRLVQRAINMEVWNARGTFQSEAKEGLVHQLDAVASWLAQYQRARSMYIGVSRRVRERADIVVDGTRSVEQITAAVLMEIKEREGDHERSR